MANYENIKGQNDKRTPSERQELARIAGKASGVSRRKKANFKKTLLALLPLKTNSQEWKALLEELEVDDTYENALNAAIIKKALNGDVKAYEAIAKYSGQLDEEKRANTKKNSIDKTNNIKYPLINIPNNGRNEDRVYVLAPQAGPQTMFMASSADIVIYGGAAGGGKTYALLLEMLRHKDVKNFGAVIFRHNYNQITAQGGLWDASRKLYTQVEGAESIKSPKLHWDFTSGARLDFAHIERDEDLDSWQGTEIAYIGFDELTHFTKRQFLYMLSRNRTTCGIKPYVRATCNPDSGSWVAEFISWWIDEKSGYPISERSGQIRYMCILNDVIYWGNSREELADKYGIGINDCKSVTFIASKLEDNKVLMENDPGYLANLKALTEVDMERLLKGNWKIKAAAGSFFKRSQVGEILEDYPTDLVAVCRGWDLAATDKKENEDAAFTAGVLMGKRSNGRFVILNVINKQLKAGDVRNTILITAKLDKQKYPFARQRLPQDPGQAGKEQAQSYIKMLSGFSVVVKAESGDKVTRAEPMAAQWQHGMFDLVAGEWNEEYLNQLESFPDSKFKDMVDASSSAFNEISLYMGFNIKSLL